MKKIKKTILNRSLELFNRLGVSEVSIRQIASEMGISHSNLIYHYKTKQDIIEALHEQLLQRAIDLNTPTRSEEVDFIKSLFESSKNGFEILYDYRFLMIDLVYILRENERLKQTFLMVEGTRAEMYRGAIEKAVQQGYMRKERYIDEYGDFIEQIKIFSDFWISSSEIYDTGNKQEILKKYSDLFVKLFFPYLTEKGRKEFDRIR